MAAKKTAPRRRRPASGGRKRAATRGRKASGRKAKARASRVKARRPARKPAKRPMKSRKARAKTKTARPKPRRAVAAKPASTPARKPAAKRPAPAAGTSRRPLIERERRRLPDLERDERLLSSVRTGREELKERLTEHTEASPTLTAGDIDARWEEAYAVGDEAPGGDNPTPDQDRVDDIGKALGIQYRPDEELQGGDEIVERDRNRWELDPASSDDWPHEGTTKRPPED